METDNDLNKQLNHLTRLVEREDQEVPTICFVSGQYIESREWHANWSFFISAISRAHACNYVPVIALH